MRKIEAKNIDKNVIKLIGQDWMLVTAGDQEIPAVDTGHVLGSQDVWNQVQLG